MREEISALLIEYLEGGLLPQERRDLEARLAGDPNLRRELESLRLVMDTLDATPKEAPSPQLRKRFEAMLAAEMKEAAAPAPSGLRIYRWEWAAAAAIALLVIGGGLGVLWQKNLRQQQQIDALVAEVVNTRKMMVLSMLQEPSASQRIKAVNTVRQEPASIDNQVIFALVNTLNTDDNVNVRVKAAEALLNFVDHPGVVGALAESLSRQDSPEVQIALIDLLVAARATEAVPGFQEILKRDDVMEVVKNKAASGIGQLM